MCVSVYACANFFSLQSFQCALFTFEILFCFWAKRGGRGYWSLLSPLMFNKPFSTHIHCCTNNSKKHYKINQETYHFIKSNVKTITNGIFFLDSQHQIDRQTSQPLNSLTNFLDARWRNRMRDIERNGAKSIHRKGQLPNIIMYGSIKLC